MPSSLRLVLNVWPIKSKNAGGGLEGGCGLGAGRSLHSASDAKSRALLAPRSYLDTEVRQGFPPLRPRFLGRDAIPPLPLIQSRSQQRSPRPKAARKHYGESRQREEAGSPKKSFTVINM